MSFRTFLIWLRFFWPVVPAVAAALGTCVVFWGLGFVWSVLVPLAVGGAVFVFFTWVQMAAGLSFPR